MHDCDVMICIGARFDDRITGRLDAFSPQSKKIHIDIDPSSINKNVKVDIPASSAIAAMCWRTWCACGASTAHDVDKAALAAWWNEIDDWRKRNCLAYRTSDSDHQAAIRRAAALRADQGPRRLRHDRGRPAPDVGRAVLPLPGAEPLDDLRRAGHHGLWPAGRHRRADGASRRAGHRHRGRSLDPDEHAGDVDGGCSIACR